MKVLFEFSRSNPNKHFDVLEATRSTLLAEGHVLTNDLLKETRRNGVVLPANVFEKLSRAISESDFVVIEGSNTGISLGYVLTKALDLGKPVLFMCDQESGNQKNRFLLSIKSKLLTVVVYNYGDDVSEILRKFLLSYPLIKTRFNLVLENKLDSFVLEQSRKLGISKTAFICSLIDRARRQR